jgi:hypothetical protein
MNEHYNYWLINLTSDDPFDYLSNGTFNQVEQKMISLVKLANATFRQVNKQNKQNKHPWSRWPMGF